MTPEAYNQLERECGRFTEEMTTRVIRRWQFLTGLAVDGFCGPDTQASIRADLAGVPAECSPLGMEALCVAIESLGKGERGGNNSGPFVEMLHGKKYDGNDDDDGAWCAAFVSWCFEQACERSGTPMPFKRSGGAKSLFRRVGDAGSFPSDPVPGDLVCWDRGKRGSWQGHVGIVERVAEGILYTVEGNVGAFPSKVMRFQHDMTRQYRLEGFARPPR